MNLIYVVSYDWASHSHHIFISMQSRVVWLCGVMLSAFLILLTSHALGQARPTVASTV